MKTHREKTLSYGRTETCDQCPWLVDSLIGRFPTHWYERMQESCLPGFNALFLCHMSPDFVDFVCPGYLLSQDSLLNNHVRLALASKKFKPGLLTALGPTYAHYYEMAAANGADITAPTPAEPSRFRAPLPSNRGKRYYIRFTSRLQIPMTDWLYTR